MRFWDSSALLPLYVNQARSEELRSWVVDDNDMAVWVLSDVEVRSAFARLLREGAIDLVALQDRALRFDSMFLKAIVIDVLPSVMARARRVLMTHPLRAADALQLGAALVACADEPARFEFVCIDARLADAARREGFTVRP